MMVIMRPQAVMDKKSIETNLPSAQFGNFPHEDYCVELLIKFFDISICQFVTQIIIFLKSHTK